MAPLLPEGWRVSLARLVPRWAACRRAGGRRRGDADAVCRPRWRGRRLGASASGSEGRWSARRNWSGELHASRHRAAPSIASAS